MRQRLIPVLAVALSATALTACGSKQAVVTTGDSEAIYVDVGPHGGPYLKYQVQLSRQLNPGDFRNAASRSDPSKVDPEDSQYVAGLTPAQLQLKQSPQKPIDGETYFGVFVAAFNESHVPLRSANTDGFEIEDTQGEHFAPVEASDPADPPNPFLYRPATVAPRDGVLPLPNSPAGAGTTQGELLLFKIPQAALENRPLTLHIKGPTGGAAEIDLDV